MHISFLCSDPDHPVNEYLQNWIEQHEHQHSLELVRSKEDLSGGDLLFLISCSQIITAKDRNQYKESLVLHASDLPLGRGWSPHIWEIIKGAEQITLALLEAKDQVDSGDIWKKTNLPIPKHFLYDEINNTLFAAELELIDFAVKHFYQIQPEPQDSGVEPTYYPKRSPQDSEIDPYKSLADQFDQLRVCDPERFPGFFKLHGKKYKISLEKIDE